ncbi:MAG: polyprenyl synthetase family protein [Ilumatobacteraceae bacterium]|nr:polyprenyl synthetase family protein [Ilumatobacteraceae bacterium]
MTPPPASLVALATRVERRIADILTPEERRWSTFDEDLASPVAEIRRLVASGGKRLRPAFCHWGFVGAGGDPDSMVSLDAGAALELLHGFALFHDDVMDGSTSRRGAPVTHEVFADEHRRSGSSGESRRYGDGIAILVGDLAFVYSDRLMSEVSAEAREIWHELRIELNVGQLLDLIGSARNERRRLKAERICRYKSGKYTIERPLHLGAMLAAPARKAELLPALSAYGLPLGDAFQMRDDVMGAFGETAITGKPVGDDLREGKPTPLMAIAMERASSAQRTVLTVVGREQLTDSQVADAQQAIVDCGALDELESVIARLRDEAVASLAVAPIATSAKTELESLAVYVTDRLT